MPTVFVTVDTALLRIASIGASSRVLVHAAAGGVGLAAMQVIAAAGATALTTAGSPAKRALLRTLGSRQVASSRDTLFAEELILEVSSDSRGGQHAVMLQLSMSAGKLQAQACYSPCLLHSMLQGGADVALNTLTSSGMVAATLATLTPGATFVEISKRDIWSAARVAQGGHSLPCLDTSAPTAAAYTCVLASDK
jgi:D-arabinose 1-dehydrogenase-like Zn-dependent alcohol dehydrogenase